MFSDASPSKEIEILRLRNTRKQSEPYLNNVFKIERGTEKKDREASSLHQAP